MNVFKHDYWQMLKMKYLFILRVICAKRLLIFSSLDLDTIRKFKCNHLFMQINYLPNMKKVMTEQCFSFIKIYRI